MLSEQFPDRKGKLSERMGRKAEGLRVQQAYGRLAAEVGDEVPHLPLLIPSLGLSVSQALRSGKAVSSLQGDHILVALREIRFPQT